MRNFKKARSMGALMAVALAATAMSACGSSDSGTSTSTSTSGAVEQDGAQAVKVGSTYIAGTPGKADPSKTPVRLGWVNQDESASGNTPENTTAADAAVSFINQELGGIDGHPVQLVKCTVGASEQQGKQCALQFLNDSSVKAVLQGMVLTGAASFIATMAPKGAALKPIVGFGPGAVSDAQLENVYYTNGGFLEAGAIPRFVKQDLKAKTASQIWSDAAGLTPFISSSVQTFKAAGLPSTVGRIPATGADTIGPLVASGAKTSDALVLNPDDAGQCIATAKGLQQLGLTEKPTVAYGACLDPSVKEQLGDFPKWIYYRDTLSPDATDPSGQVATVKYAANKYAPSEAKAGAMLNGGYSLSAFGEVMVAAKWLNAMGADKISTDGFAEQAKAMKGGIFLGYPTPKFGQQPFPALAANALRFYKYDGDGKFSDATDGKWVPAS